MPTTFPLSTYPLDDRTRFKDDHIVKRDKMDDGSLYVRVVGSGTDRLIRCVFSPMYSDDAETFAEYLRTNRTTDFDLIYKSVTYRGYIWSDIDIDPFDGDCSMVSFDFCGEAV